MKFRVVSVENTGDIELPYVVHFAPADAGDRLGGHLCIMRPYLPFVYVDEIKSYEEIMEM